MNPKDIMDRIEQVREERHLTRAAFSRAIGSNPQTYGNHVGQQETPPNLKLVASVSTTYNIPLEWLVFGRGEAVRVVTPKRWSFPSIFRARKGG